MVMAPTVTRYTASIAVVFPSLQPKKELGCPIGRSSSLRWQPCYGRASPSSSTSYVTIVLFSDDSKEVLLQVGFFTQFDLPSLKEQKFIAIIYPCHF